MDTQREQRRRLRRVIGTTAHVAFYVLMGSAVLCAISPALLGAPLAIQRFSWLLVSLAAIALLVGYAGIFWSLRRRGERTTGSLPRPPASP